MLQIYWKFANFLGVYDLAIGKFVTSRCFVAVCCVNFICTDKKGCSESYLRITQYLDLYAEAMLAESSKVVWLTSAAVQVFIFFSLPALYI